MLGNGEPFRNIGGVFIMYKVLINRTSFNRFWLRFVGVASVLKFSLPLGPMHVNQNEYNSLKFQFLICTQKSITEVGERSMCFDFRSFTCDKPANV